MGSHGFRPTLYPWSTHVLTHGAYPSDLRLHMDGVAIVAKPTRTPKRTPFLVYVGRFLIGGPMNGVPRTDSTWFRGATKDLTHHGRSARWHHWPGWKRSVWRVGVLSALIGFAYGYATVRTLTLALALAFLIIAAGFGMLRAHLRLRDWHIDRRIGIPLYGIMSAFTGHNPSDNHRKHIRIPRDYHKNTKARVTVMLPYAFEGTPDHQKRLHGLISRRLGGEWDADWNFHEHPPRVHFRRAPSPPGFVGFRDIFPYLEKSDGNKVIIGISTHEGIAEISLDNESPHVAVSMGTGGGKSSLLRLIVTQLIRHGVERVDIIDPKRISHIWARGIPGVHIHTTMAAQMKAVREFRQEMESRYDELEVDNTLEFPRRVLIIEEQNSFISYARQYWADYRNELEPSDRAKVAKANPVISDLGFILFQGRQSRMNVFSVFQRMSASASGGGDLRENYYAKLLARFSAQTWKLLVGTSPVPRSSRINGRGKMVLGEDDRWVQFAFVTEAEAQEYAAMRSAPVTDTSDHDPDDGPVTLREAADAKVIPLRYAALRRAKARAGDSFPTGIPAASGVAYKPSELRAWFDARPSRRFAHAA